MATKKLDVLDGQSDVTEFVDRVELYGLMTGYTEENCCISAYVS